MVNASECEWSEEQVKGLITFLLAEKHRHERDIHHIERSIERLRRKYNLTEADMEQCEKLAWLFVDF